MILWGAAAVPAGGIGYLTVERGARDNSGSTSVKASLISSSLTIVLALAQQDTCATRSNRIRIREARIDTLR